MNLQRNRLVNRIVGLSTGEPSSQTLYSTFPHCPKARKLLSMTWDTPALKPNTASLTNCNPLVIIFLGKKKVEDIPTESKNILLRLLVDFRDLVRI